MSFTANTIAYVDGLSANKTAKSYTDGTNDVPAHVVFNSTGTIIDPATSGNQTTANTSLATIATAVQAALPAGTNLIGQVSEIGCVNLTSTPTITAGAYTTGQVVGGLITLTGAVRTNGNSGLLQSVNVCVKTALTAPYDVFFFGTNPTNSTFTDNAALAINVADLPFLVPGGIVHCNDGTSGGTPQILQATNLAIPFKNGSSNTSLYAVIVIRGGQTFASTSAIVFNVGIKQD